MKFKNLALIMHSNGIHGVTYALANFLKKHCETLILIQFPIDGKESLLNKTTIEVFKDGSLNETIYLTKKQNSIKDHFIHLQESISGLKRIMKKHHIKKFDAIWGTDPLTALGAILNKWLLRSEKTIFYVVDYSEDRFGNKLVNWLYRLILKFTVKASDTNWNVNSSIKASVEKITGRSTKNLVTLPSTDLSKVDTGKAKKNPWHIVIVSNLGPSLDIDLTFDSYSILKMEFPKLKMTIIGDGPGRTHLEKRLKESNDKSLTFKGALGYEDLLKLLPNFHIGLAPYARDETGLKNWNFANNLTTKYVDYIACGLPVVSTNAIPGSKKLAELGCGLESECEAKDFASKIRTLIKDKRLHQIIREKGLEVVKNYSSDAIYMDATKKTF